MIFAQDHWLKQFLEMKNPIAFCGIFICLVRRGIEQLNYIEIAGRICHVKRIEDQADE